jgi:hypothetical protein
MLRLSHSCNNVVWGRLPLFPLLIEQRVPTMTAGHEGCLPMQERRERQTDRHG